MLWTSYEFIFQKSLWLQCDSTFVWDEVEYVQIDYPAGNEFTIIVIYISLTLSQSISPYDFYSENAIYEYTVLYHHETLI